MPFEAAQIFNAGNRDPAIPAGSPRVVDASGTPGDVVVASGVREIKVQQVVGQSELLITHPDITAASHVVGSFDGNSGATPESTRRDSYRAGAGFIIVSISGGAIAGDGAQTITVRVA